MTANWPRVRLGDILHRSETIVELQPDLEYRQITLKLWGKGVTLRGVLKGAEIAAPRQVLARRDQFILSRIDARNGALGIVPPELDGAIVSSDFPVFNVVADRMLPAYLGWICKTAAFVEECQRASEGTTNRVRLQEDRFLAGEIPLPPLAEQRRLVARIEELGRKVEEARLLRHWIREENEALWSSALGTCFEFGKYPVASLESACLEIIDNLHSTPTYDGDDFACIRSQDVGWGLINFDRALRVSDVEFMERTRRGEPKGGDIVFVREGEIGRCAFVDGHRRFCLGQRVMMFRPNAQIVNSRFLMHQLMSPGVLNDQILNIKTGTTSHHVNIKHLREVHIQVPSLPEQRRIVAYLDHLQEKTDALKGLQAETSTELDALMPSILNQAFLGHL